MTSELELELSLSDKHVFVGREICIFQVRQINNLRAESKLGIWAIGLADGVR
jgi:hypothetical protein